MLEHGSLQVHQLPHSLLHLNPSRRIIHLAEHILNSRFNLNLNHNLCTTTLSSPNQCTTNPTSIKTRSTPISNLCTTTKIRVDSTKVASSTSHTKRHLISTIINKALKRTRGKDLNPKPLLPMAMR